MAMMVDNDDMPGSVRVDNINNFDRAFIYNAHRKKPPQFPEEVKGER